MHIQHYSSQPPGSWQLDVTRPDPLLRRGIHSYRGIRKEPVAAAAWLGMPATVVTLVLSFDADRPQRLTGSESSGHGTPTVEFASLLCGPNLGTWTSEIPKGFFGVEIVLTPMAAFTMFGLAVRDVTARAVDPGDAVNRRIDDLAGTLAALPDWTERFAFLDETLRRWLADGCAWSPRVEWAYGQLARTAGRYPIAALADTTGWTTRQLENRFREQVGLTPKAAARVFRVRRAHRQLTAGNSPAFVAAACGYSDQAHLTREFATLLGRTPARLYASLEPDFAKVQDLRWRRVTVSESSGDLARSRR